MKKYVLSLLVAFSYFSVQAINPKLLQGTHTIVPPDYSPVMGLPFLEWDIAEQWYKLSARSQAAQSKEILDANPQALSDNPELTKFIASMGKNKNSATENLIMSMFHMAGGTFNVTNADGNPVKYLKPKHIGKILQLVQKWSQASESSEKMEALKLEVSVKRSRYEAQIKQLQKETSQLNAKRLAAEKANNDTEVAKLQTELNLKTAELKKIQDLLKKLADPASKDFAKIALQQELSDLCIGFELKNGKTQQLFQENEWRPFVSSLVGSIQETTGDQRSYAENTPEGILLGYMLKTSNTREDLQDYFRGFLGNDSFVLPPEQEYSSEEIQQILAAKTDAADFEKLGDLLSVYTYQEKYSASFPKVVDSKQADFHNISFSDCMDTTIRMLTNIVTYQKSKNKVGVAPEGLRLNPAVKDFYASKNGLCAQSAEVGNSIVHQAWAQVIENVPGCVYAQIGTGSQDSQHVVASGFEGFMPVNSAFIAAPSGKIEIDGIEYEPYSLQLGTKTYNLAQKKVGDATYLLVPQNSELVCCEMRSSLLNIITGLDYVFNLGLYSNIDQLFEPDFVANNFEKMCEKFGWNLQIDIAHVDESRFIDIPIETEAGRFSIHLYHRQHGYVTVESNAELEVELEVPSIIPQSIAAAIVAARLKKVKDLPQNLQARCLDRDIDILNYDQRFDALVQIVHQGESSFNEEEKAYIQSLIFSFSFVDDQIYLERLVENFGPNLKEAGLSDFVVGVLRLYEVTHTSNIMLKLLVPLIKSKLMTFDQLKSLLEEGLIASDYNTEKLAKEAMVNLIDERLVTFKQLSSILEKSMSDPRRSVRSFALLAISHYIGNGLVQVVELVPLLEKWMMGSNNELQASSYEIIKTLISTGGKDISAQLLPLIEKLMGSSNPDCQTYAKFIIERLSDKDPEISNQLLPLIEKWMATSDVTTQISGLDLMDRLIDEKLMTLKQASKLLPSIEKMMEDSDAIDQDFDIQDKAFVIMNSLVIDNLTTSDQVPQLLSLIKKGIKSKKGYIREHALDLVNSLIIKNLILADQVLELLPLLEQEFKSIAYDIHVRIIKIIKSLVDKKMITKSEIEAIEKLSGRTLDWIEKEQFARFKSEAPVSIQERKVETKMKAKAKLSEKQKREIIEIAKRTKKQRLMEVQQEQLRQEEEQRQIADEQHLAQHHEVEPQLEQ